MLLSTEKEYEIYYFYIDANMNMAAIWFTKFFQDIFSAKSSEIGRGIPYFLQKGLVWIVCKWDISIYKLPAWGEKIKVKLIPFAYKKTFVNLKYEVFSANGEKLAEAMSLWSIMDIKTRRPFRTTLDEIYEIYDIDPKGNKVNTLSKLKPCENPGVKSKLRIGYFDIDSNGHVNNTNYIKWFMEDVPKEILLGYDLKEIKVNYKNECKEDSTIYVCTEVIKDGESVRCIHEIIDEDDTVVTLGETSWSKSTVEK